MQSNPLVWVPRSMPFMLANIRRAQPLPSSGRPMPEGMPVLARVLGSRTLLRSSIFLGARDLWSTCLNAALAGVIVDRDSRAWSDLLILPSLVIPSPSRGGTSRTRRSTNETRRRCQDWLNEVRLEPWEPLPKHTPARNPRKGQLESNAPSFDLDDATARRVHTLISEGSLRKACTALTAEPPATPTSEVVDKLRRLHPGPAESHLDAINRLRTVSPGAVPAIDPEMVRKALASFAPTSGAGPSGPRPSHLPGGPATLLR